MKTLLGSELHADDKRFVLASYVHRYTGDFTPDWAKENEQTRYIKFNDDAHWLASTRFCVKKNGRLDKRSAFCESTITLSIPGRNNDCNGSGPCSENPEVRVLPLDKAMSAGGNVMLCRACFGRELEWRSERNKKLAGWAAFDLPAWESLRVG